MLFNEEEDNQYAGLVARGHSFYAPQRSPRPAPKLPSAAANSSSSTAATVKPTTVPALERRTSSTIIFPPRTSSSTFVEAHDPYTDDQQVDITPILLNKVQEIVLATSDASNANRVNRYQVALANRRMKLISTTLRQMPHPAPSPRLLTALQSLCLLARQCAYDPAGVGEARASDADATQRFLYGPDGDPLGPSQCWQVLLRQHFTARLLFRHVYQRLWSAWRMYSPTKLEHENVDAEAHDREVDADAMLQLLFAAGGSPALESTLSAATVAQYKKDMLAYYQRREMSPWRVFYRELKPTDQPVNGGAHTVANSPPQWGASAPPLEAEERSFRFRVLPTVYLYNNVPVVVKALCAATPLHASGPTASASILWCNDCDAETEAVAMAHAMDFSQDVACRCMWCHPHIVGCLGAYTEKFVPYTGGNDSKCATADYQAHDTPPQHDAIKNVVDLVNSQLPAPLKSNTSAQTPSASTHTMDLPWSPRIDALSGTPIMALGYITELQTLSWPSSNTKTPCVTLGDMLFASSPTAPRHYFTLSEALDICAQLADGLQYILEDGGDVPATVRTAWLTLDPSNVYVVRIIQSTAPASQQAPQRLQLSRKPSFTVAATEFTGGGVEAGPARVAAVRRDSVVFTESVFNKNSQSHNENTQNDVVVPERAQREHTPLLELPAKPTVHVDPAPNSTPETFRRGSTQIMADGCTFIRPAAGAASPRRFVVRFCPPASWTDSNDNNIMNHGSSDPVGSRWRPHPRATAPASYVIAQLLIALITRQVPYAAYRSDAEVQRRVFDVAATVPAGTCGLADAEAAARVRVKLGSSGQGYSIPASLPPALVQWCRQALSLDKTQPPMELESLRDALTMIQMSLAEASSHMEATQDAPRVPSSAAQSQEMSARFDAAFL